VSLSELLGVVFPHLLGLRIEKVSAVGRSVRILAGSMTDQATCIGDEPGGMSRRSHPDIAVVGPSALGVSSSVEGLAVGVVVPGGARASFQRDRLPHILHRIGTSCRSGRTPDPCPYSPWRTRSRVTMWSRERPLELDGVPAQEWRASAKAFVGAPADAEDGEDRPPKQQPPSRPAGGSGRVGHLPFRRLISAVRHITNPVPHRSASEQTDPGPQP
jgi:hypothetical protein